MFLLLPAFVSEAVIHIPRTKEAKKARRNAARRQMGRKQEKEKQRST
jgi:hypothetical protein